jgi:hypothetical protein
MASYASPDAKGRDVEIGIDAEYSQTKQPSTLTGCVGRVATNPAGRRALVNEQARVCAARAD